MTDDKLYEIAQSIAVVKDPPDGREGTATGTYYRSNEMTADEDEM